MNSVWCECFVFTNIFLFSLVFTIWHVLYVAWAAAGREDATQYVRCRGSASRAPRQSASEGIYWFCRQVEKNILFKVKCSTSSFKNNNNMCLKITWVTMMCVSRQTLTWWWQRSTGPGVSRRSSGPCRSDPSPWPLPGPPPLVVGLTRLSDQKRNRKLWNLGGRRGCWNQSKWSPWCSALFRVPFNWQEKVVDFFNTLIHVD